MSNVDKAVQVIYNEVNQTWERGEILTAAGEAERLANALAQALGAAIHDYKGCGIPDEQREALIEEAVAHIAHGIGIAHAMDEREA